MKSLKQCHFDCCKFVLGYFALVVCLENKMVFE